MTIKGYYYTVSLSTVSLGMTESSMLVSRVAGQTDSSIPDPLLETGQTNCSHTGLLAGTGQTDNSESDSTAELKLTELVQSTETETGLVDFS